jgi:hypothetical protein
VTPGPFDRAVRRDTAPELEIRRICRLPTTDLPTDEEVEALSRELIQADYFDGGFRLRPEQAGAVLDFLLYDGLIGPIGVGKGKTFISLLIADQAFRQGTSKRSLLVVPPTLLPQLVPTDIPDARRKFGIRVPFTVMAGRSLADRRAAARSGRVGCYILPYSLLSTRDAEEVLEAIEPDLVILDEAHRVKNHRAARTARLMRMFKRCEPRVVALSGTLTSKSIMDYHHLASWALRGNSPLPLHQELVQSWAALLDAGAGEDPGSAQTGPIVPLLDWAREHFPGADIPRGLPGFRAAFRLRLNSAPGVVCSGDSDIGTSLLIHNVPVAKPEAQPGHDEVVRLMKQVEDLWISPSGDEIEHGMHKWRHLYELSSGFFYRLRWPEPAELTAKRPWTLAEASAYLEQAQAHHEAKQRYHKLLRIWIAARGRPGLDTPMLVGSDMARHGNENVRDREMFEAWTEARSLEFEGMPERISEPVRISPWKVRHVARLMVEERDLAVREKGTPGVIGWYWHREFGRWLVEELEAMGEDPLFCPADSERPGSSARLLDPASTQRLVVASMAGHGEGKNLQAFQREVLGEFPRKADLLEQVLGRLHRPGQQADELVPKTVNSSEFDHENMSAALIDALYIQQTTGTRQKAVYCSYDPLPRMYPIDFLRERGFMDVAALDPAALAVLEERFGSLTPG